MDVTITENQRNKFFRMGNRLIKSRLTTGFQLEDYDPKPKRHIIYGHDNPSHLRIVQSEINGKIYPRESYYLWDNFAWIPGPNTTLLFNNTLARAKEEYLSSPNINNAKRFFSRRTIAGKGHFILGSWIIPDIRIYGVGVNCQIKNYKNAYLITKRIDYNSRMAMVATKKRKMHAIRNKLKYERVKRIKVQDYKPKKHSFFEFINSI